MPKKTTKFEMKTNASPEKQQEPKHYKMAHNSNMSPTSIPCFSTDMPPEYGTKIVVECNRVDDNGVWGSLAGWESNCTAYIPVGFVVPQLGRGERRAQADFLTRAKRQCSKGKPISVVAIVESIEAVSSNGVGLLSNVSGAQICETFLITATRRGLEKSEEKGTLDSLKNTQRCAALLVDKAAAQANFGQAWAREVCLYQPRIVEPSRQHLTSRILQTTRLIHSWLQHSSSSIKLVFWMRSMSTRSKVS